MYRTANAYYKEKYGCKVYKLSLDGGVPLAGVIHHWNPYCDKNRLECGRPCFFCRSVLHWEGSRL